MADFFLRIAALKPRIDYVSTPTLDLDTNSIPVAISRQGTPVFETSSADFIYSSQVPGLPFIPAATLATAPKWLVRYQAAFGGGPWAFGVRVPHINVMSNRAGANPPNSDKTYGGGEGLGMGSGLPEASRCSYVGGWFMFTPDGTDLEFRMRVAAGQPAVFFSGMTLIAIPVTTSADQRKLVQSVDLFGSQMEPPNAGPTITTTEPFVTVLEHTENIPSDGSYLVIASCQADTTVGNKVQFRMMLDGAEQKSAARRLCKDNRDDFPFIYESYHSLNSGSHVFRIEGGSAGGVSPKNFRSARIWIIRVDNFERWALGLRTEEALVDAEYPNWSTNDVLNREIVPFSTVGEYALIIGNVLAETSFIGSVMARLYNETRVLPTHEFVSSCQVDDPGENPGDPTYLSTVGCELVNSHTTYRLDVTRNDVLGPFTDNTRMSYRELIILGLTKKAGPPPATVSILINDFANSGETFSTPGIRLVNDFATTGEIVTLVGDAPPDPIPLTHPRLPWFTPERISYLRNQAGYDDDGNQIGPGSIYWQNLLAQLPGVDQTGDGGRDYAQWQYALAYLATQNPTYLQWIKDHITRICNSNINGWESLGLTTGRWVRQACIIYDICYNDLTAQERTHFQDFILGVMYAIMNSHVGIWNGGGSWSRNDPSNNYFFSFHQATAFMAVTLYHDTFPENPTPTFAWPPGSGLNIRQWWLPLRHGQTSGPTYTDGLQYFSDRFQQITIPVWDGNEFPQLGINSGTIVGGGWHEGEWYKPMWSACDAFILAEYAGLPLTYQNIDLKDFIHYRLHSPLPQTTRPPELGDSGSADVRKSVNMVDRIVMLHMARKYRNDPEGQWAQWWLHHILAANPNLGDHQFDGHDFMLYEAAIPQVDFRPLAPKAWLSLGNSLAFSRTGWGALDRVSMMTAGNRRQLHMHGDMGSVQIWSGRGAGGDRNFLVGPRCAYGSSGENQAGSWEAIQHCTYKLAGCQQRGWNTQTLDLNDLEPTAFIRRYWPDPDGNFVYAQGDASNAYRLNLAGWSSTGQPGKRAVEVFQREFVDIPGMGILLTYDRVKLRATSPDGSPVPQTVEGHLHYPKPAPVVNGDIATLNSGTARLFRRFVYPAGQPSTFIDEGGEGGINFGCVDEVINLTVTNRYSRLLTAFENTDNTQTDMSPVTPLAGGPDVEGVSVEKAGQRIHVVFTKAEDGSEPPNPFFYTVHQLNDTDRHIICNLDPGQAYAVTPTFLGSDLWSFQLTKNAIGFVASVGELDGGTVTFLVSQIPTQFDSVIFAEDFALTAEATNLIAPKIITTLDGADSGEPRVDLVTEQQVFIFAHDFADGVEDFAITGPLNCFDGASGVETTLLESTGGSPVTVYKEKKITMATGPIVPAGDDLISFFDPEPSDGSAFDKLADEDDGTFIVTSGPNAQFAQCIFRLADPGTFVHGIRQFYYKIKTGRCDLDTSQDAKIIVSLGGLGLAIQAESLRSVSLHNNPGFGELHTTEPVRIHIPRTKFPDWRLAMRISGNPIGGKFFLAIQRIEIVPTLITGPEKKI